ncbi:glutamate decarboxylase [Microbulbifer sp. OS29]|uniref:Glutamate decarboxylase n=1 Tax=Microbulbifer okhotskensis TaxID=2926617 RepID=A0A9X2ER99_9GAMM|nr:glutamate decarboxylase [Microbulbifer okhotskensis]MCO1334236.1 glutamate decarboxylase [Microbulbifer okhotskensis]
MKQQSPFDRFFDEYNEDIPEDHFPTNGISAHAAEAIVASETWSDAKPAMNLSSFVTTFTEPEAFEVAKKHYLKNYIDHDMYPQLFAMESRMVRWLHELWNGPKDVEPYGAATIGSSEACMLAGLAHKWNWRKQREKSGKNTSSPNLVTGANVQIVWEKFMRYFDVEPRIAPLMPGHYRFTSEHLDKLVDENTIAVVAIAGQTFTGEDDAFRAIHNWLDKHQEKTGQDIPLHIDGASGGFVNPFLYPHYKWDFRLPRVKSINASGHKFGLVPPGLGWVIFRERSVFCEDLMFYVNYLGGEMPTATLNFSRNASTVAYQYYNFIRLGFNGYRDIMRHTLENAKILRTRLVDSGYFEIMNRTQRIPVVAMTLNNQFTHFNEYDISDKVRERGWVLSAYSMPPNAQAVNSLRIVVRPHLNLNAINGLADDIIFACDWLKQHGGNASPPNLHNPHKVAPSKC